MAGMGCTDDSCQLPISCPSVWGLEFRDLGFRRLVHSNLGFAGDLLVDASLPGMLLGPCLALMSRSRSANIIVIMPYNHDSYCC